MTEQSETEKYIKCSKCRCKYINDVEHIKTDLGYNRLNEKFKTCVKCRTNRNQNPIKINVVNTNIIECDCCGNNISKNGIWQHKKTNDCKQITYWKDKVDVNDPNINFFVYTDNTYHPYYIDTTERLNIEGHNPEFKQIETIRLKRKDEYFNYNN